MIDIKLLRTDPDKVRGALASRDKKFHPTFSLDEIIAKDGEYRAALAEIENLRSRRNEMSANIQKAKISGDQEAFKQAMSAANAAKEAVKSREESISAMEKGLRDMLLTIPNLPDSSVPVGKDSTENIVVAEHIEDKRDFSFKPADHQSVGEKLGILDFERAVKLSGARFALYRGLGARLERSITQLMLNTHTAAGYQEMGTPQLVTAETMTGTGQLPKFECDLYKTRDEVPMYLIPTAEVTLTNTLRGETLQEKDLPVKLTAYTQCFRQEAGTYGRDTRGLIRNHQFGKVELMWFTRPEDSMEALEKLRSDAEKILKLLKLPYRVVQLCTGDLGFGSVKSYDLEVWMPSSASFCEISTCSNCWDFQARRMNTRYRAVSKKLEFVHTLNGSGLATGRTLAAVLENYQNEDGSVTVPEALRPYMGVDKIG